jgi:hypothetical protein
MGKKSGSGSGMNNPDHISEILKTIFLNSLMLIRDPGWKKSDPDHRENFKAFFQISSVSVLIWIGLKLDLDSGLRTP